MVASHCEGPSRIAADRHRRDFARIFAAATRACCRDQERGQQQEPGDGSAAHARTLSTAHRGRADGRTPPVGCDRSVWTASEPASRRAARFQCPARRQPRAAPCIRILEFVQWSEHARPHLHRWVVPRRPQTVNPLRVGAHPSAPPAASSRPTRPMLQPRSALRRGSVPQPAIRFACVRGAGRDQCAPAFGITASKFILAAAEIHAFGLHSASPMASPDSIARKGISLHR